MQYCLPFAEMPTFYIFITVGVISSQSYDTTVCKDEKQLCHAWAQHGFCADNPAIALRICERSCKTCTSGITERETYVYISDGGWSSWVTWSACSVTCGAGFKSRSRTCTNPHPSSLGKACEGTALDVTACKEDTCHVVTDRAPSSDVITSADCDCGYHPGGCSISKPAPSGMACHCVYKVIWKCRGIVTQCSNPDSNFFAHPDYSVHSCLLGGGDCEGYKTATCDCAYSSGGCTIIKAPPPNTACYCEYKILWKCVGRITQCKDFNSYYCKNPDYSINTCRIGGGDCGGY